MEIKNLKIGYFISRPNRFTVEFKDKLGNIELAHLHDPGRLKELLINNTEILIEYVPNYKKTNRKTKYNMIAIKYNENWVLLNSGFHNKIVEELIINKNIKGLEKYQVNKREYTHGKSRFDFLLSDENNNLMFLEVKGCTLVVNNLAKFPDAPTTRGTRHVLELTDIKKNGIESSVVILILQNSAKEFTPNKETDPDFSNALKEAYKANVNIFPFQMLTEYKDNILYLKPNKLLPLVL